MNRSPEEDPFTLDHTFWFVKVICGWFGHETHVVEERRKLYYFCADCCKLFKVVEKTR